MADPTRSNEAVDQAPERWIVHGETADTVCYGLLRKYFAAARILRSLLS
jgi:hypothetical protein